MKKKYIGQEWSENRLARFQLGIILALLFVNYAFNYEGQRPAYLPEDLSQNEDYVEQNAILRVQEPPLPKQILSTPDVSIEIPDIPLQEIDYHKVSLEISDNSNVNSEQNTYVFEQANRMELPPEQDLSIDEITSNKPLSFAERMPLYEACISENQNYDLQLECTMNEIMKIIRQKLKYPAIARENGIQGTVIGSFVVDKSGKIGSIKIERETGFGLDKAVIEVFQHIPKFIPAEQNDKKVSVKMHIPVKFKLAE